jgi:nitroreductase
MDVLEAIRTRRSVRAYSPKAIPADALDRMRSALRWAPSACNLQPWHFILVTDPDLRRQVAESSHRQLWMAGAPVTIVGCGLPDRAYQHMGGRGCSVEVDVAIALDHLTLAAAAEGLGTCWIGAFDEIAVKRILGVPAGVKVVALTPLGYPASADLLHAVDEQRRRPAAEVFSTDRYQGPGA